MSYREDRRAARLGGYFWNDGDPDEALGASFHNRNVHEWDRPVGVAAPVWMAQALCALPRFSSLPFSGKERRGPIGINTTEAMRAVCAECPVWLECLEDALEVEAPGHSTGMRGGLTAAERDATQKNINDDARPVVPTWVYFASREQDDAIKIGWSSNPTERMRALHATLLATMPGGRYDEQHLHAQFSDSRVEGEWFRPTPELLGLIVRVLEDEATCA